MKSNTEQNSAPAADEAVASMSAESWMQNQVALQAAAGLSANERTSLSALISYVAHNSGEHEFGIERRLSDRFNIPNVNCLLSTDYDTAIRYLVDGIEGVSA